MSTEFEKYGFPDGKRYNSFVGYFRRKYGERLHKIVLDAGFTCPNRDGNKGMGGCTYCNNQTFNPDYCKPTLTVTQQLEDGIRFFSHKYPSMRYLAYFQAYTNTYASLETLRAKYEEALSVEGCVGIVIGTRPDCLGDDVLDLLAELNEIKPVWVELGLQTIHEDTARYIRRGYPAQVYFDAVKKLKKAGIEVVTHIILGLPGETTDMMIATTQAAVAAGTDGVKFHLLHVIEHTDLAKLYRAGEFEVLSMERYFELLAGCIERIPPEMVVHRLTGDGDKRTLLAPLWSGNKKHVLNSMNRYFDEIGLVQGNMLK